MNRIFVGGIPKSAKESSRTCNTATLKKHFSQYGKVRKAEIIKNRDTGMLWMSYSFSGKSRCFGFIELQDEATTTRILTLEHCINSKIVDFNL